MKRSAFAFGSLAFALTNAAWARGVRTALILESSVPELDDELTNNFAEALRARGVSILDPSSIRMTYHKRASILAIAFGPLTAISAESVAWVERRYNSPRALFARLRISSSSLPYGEFTIHKVQATCSFRCFDVRSHQLIKAASARSERRGEDLQTVQSLAANDSILAVSRAAATALT